MPGKRQACKWLNRIEMNESDLPVKETFHDIVKGEKPVLVDFFATWCEPCKAQMPILDEVARVLGDQVRILKIDVERNPGISSQVGVRGVPTLVIYHRGELKWRSSGLQGARELVNALRKFLS